MIRFSDVRNQVTAQDAARFYGAEFDRRGWAICPFHQDQHPSISFKGSRFRCWSCGASGDALDYVSRLFNLDSVQAAKRLDVDFGLGLDGGGESEEASKAEQERRRVATLHTQFELWRTTTIDRLNSVSYLAHIALKRGPEFTEQEVSALRFAVVAEYIADQLEAGTPEDQAQIYRERGEIEIWTDRALRNS